MSPDLIPGRKGAVLRAIPDFMVGMAGAVSARSIDVVLDASGFAFSDQWGPGPANNLLSKMNQLRRRHQKLILMPQAFGPFSQGPLSDITKKLFERSSLVYARDKVSFDYCMDLKSDSDIRQCPDITILETPQGTVSETLPERFFAVVPNVQMKRKTTDIEGGEYLKAVDSVAKILTSQGLSPVILLHDYSTDVEFVPGLKQVLGDVPVVTGNCPLELKAIIGNAELVVASRFHALVAALSQCVPTIAIGWSHKYACLLQDFGCPELLLRLPADIDLAESAVTSLVVPESRNRIQKEISSRLSDQKNRVNEMWSRVIDCIKKR